MSPLNPTDRSATSRPALPRLSAAGTAAAAAPAAPSRRACLRWALAAGVTLPGIVGLGAGLSGCALVPQAVDEAAPERPAFDAQALAASAWARQSVVQGSTGDWEHQTFRGRRPTHYQATEHQGRPAMHALCEGSNSLLRRRVQLPPSAWGELRFAWWVDALNPKANLSEREANDAVARIILTFDGDRSGWSARDHALSDLAQLFTGEPMPHATLMYVWDNRHPVGSVLSDPNTSRVRLMVLRSGSDELGRWSEERRDVRADYARAFAEPATALSGLGLMTDSNNTGQRSEAWYAPISLGRA